MTKVEELIKKYNLAADQYKAYEECPKGTVAALQKKYEKKIATMWYGFEGMQDSDPYVWLKVMDEFLEYVFSICPDAEILQIKLKFGYGKMYLKNIPDDVQKQIDKLESVLFLSKLIY